MKMAKIYGANTEAGRQLQKQREAEQQAKIRRAKIVNRVVIIGCAVICVAVILLNIFVSKPATEENIKSTENAVAAAQKKRDDIKERVDTGADIEYIDPAMGNAGKTVKEICDLQNKLAEYDYESTFSGNSISKDYGDILLQYSGLTGGSKDVWTHAMSEEQIRALKNEKGDDITSQGCPYVWVCDNDFTYEGSSLTVVFLCYEKSDTEHDKLLSLVSGKYDEQTHTVTDIVQIRYNADL